MNRAVTALRIIDTGVKPARWNIAMTAALMELHRIGSTPDTIRFHRYPRSVLIGRNQKLEQEVDVERCRRDGVEIARRVTGGGAVYMSPGILAWDIVAGRARFGDTLEDVTLRINSTVAAGLAQLGCAAKVGAQGAVEIDGRKVSGSSGGFDGPTVIVQGTALIEFDQDEMMRLLRKGNTPVTSLAGCLGRTPPVEVVRAALLLELNNVWDGASVTSDLRSDELALGDRLLADEIGSDAFVMGTPAKRQGTNP
jgi:lipoate-protein ligase A